MRLEDWQKFIESQFLEDNGAVPSASAGEQEKALATENSPQKSIPREEISAAVAVAEKPASVQLYPSFVNSPQTQKSDIAPAEQTAAKSVRSPFVPVTLGEDEMPEFGAYLPSYAVTETRIETIAESEPTPTVLAVDLEQSPQTPVSSSPELESPKRRIPKSRARHLRAAQEVEPLKEIEPTELWSSIPKYLETLLAMERTDDLEVAQYSYKSPFLEKRRELIHRLLDPELSIEETARLLCVCPTTVRRYTNRGILRCYRKEVAQGREQSVMTYDTRQRRFRLTDILLFLETHHEMLDKDRRHDAKTLFTPPSIPHLYSQESE